MYCDLVLLRLISKKDWEILTYLIDASKKATRRLEWMECREYVHMNRRGEELTGAMTKDEKRYLRRLPKIIYRI
jgi:hypothetical protein